MREIGVRVNLVEPGFIKTNFANAVRFSNDRSLSEYQRLVDKLWEVAASMRADGVESVVAAEAVFTAATDGTDQLRDTVGEDARLWASQRDSQDDAMFFAGMRTLFGQ